MSAADELASRLAEFMAKEVGDSLGMGYKLAGLDWAPEQPEDDDAFPWLMRDSEGRRFEVEWDVTVTELTPELQAQRDADVKRWQALSDAHGGQP